MSIDSSQYFIILFRVNQVFTFYHFITHMSLGPWNPTKKWPTGWTFWVTCYLEIMFPTFLTLDPHPLKACFFVKLDFEIAVDQQTRLRDRIF